MTGLARRSAMLAVGLGVACGARSRRVDVDGDVDVDVDVDVDMDTDVDPLCDSNPHAPGCPCDAMEPEICYQGPESSLGVGACHVGFQICRSGLWGACEGQVLPSDEVCDAVDDDCDGEVDEGVTNECGTCAAECTWDCVGVDCAGFEASADNSSGVEEDAKGALVLVPGGATGWYSHVFRGCDSGWGTSWSTLDFEAEVPAGASITFEARTGSDLAELAAAAWTHVGSVPPDEPPIDLDAALGYGYGYDYLEVRVTLVASKDGASPRLLWLSTDYFCGGDID